MNESNKLVIENAKVKWKNFGGRVSEYDPKGEKKNVNIVLTGATNRANGLPFTLEDIKALEADGWKIDEHVPEVNEGETTYSIKCTLRWKPDKGTGPRVFAIYDERRVKKALDEATVKMLDTVQITTVDVVIRPYEYKPGKIAAYVDQLCAHVKEDAFDLKYADFATN